MWRQSRNPRACLSRLTLLSSSSMMFATLRGGDWSKATVDAAGDVGSYTSVAVGADGDPVVSYRAGANHDLSFAICDQSASTHGNCGQTGDWSMVAMGAKESVGALSSVADVGGNPMRSSYDGANTDLHRPQVRRRLRRSGA